MDFHSFTACTPPTNTTRKSSEACSTNSLLKSGISPVTRRPSPLSSTKATTPKRRSESSTSHAIISLEAGAPFTTRTSAASRSRATGKPNSRAASHCQSTRLDLKSMAKSAAGSLSTTKPLTGDSWRVWNAISNRPSRTSRPGGRRGGCGLQGQRPEKPPGHRRCQDPIWQTDYLFQS